MIKRHLIMAAATSAALIMAACTAPEREQAATDLLAGQKARCAEAAGLFDEAPGVWAGVLTATACAG